MAKAVLRSQHRRCPRTERSRGGAITRRLIVGDELSRDRHEHGPASGVRMATVVRARGPHEDARLDAPAGGDRDLDLALTLIWRERAITRETAAVERPVAEESVQRRGSE